MSGYPYLVVCALLFASGIAHATTWKTIKTHDPFTDTENVTVGASGDHGGGFLLRCYEGDLGLFLRIPPSVVAQEQTKRQHLKQQAATATGVTKIFLSFKLEHPTSPNYRFRIDHSVPYTYNGFGGTPRTLLIGHATYVNASDDTDQTDISGLGVSLTKIIGKLRSGHLLVYQIPPNTGPVYKISLSGSAQNLGPVVRDCEGKNKRKAEQIAGQQKSGPQGKNKAQVNKLLGQYQAAIQQKVQNNWLRPPGVTDEVKCQVTVEQSHAGDVLSVKLDNSCGSPVLNRSVENAVKRASPLPAPPDPSVFQRTLVFNFDSSEG